MLRIRLEFARPHMQLARPVRGADGRLVAGAGTTLTPAAVRSLRRCGVRSVWVREVEGVNPWEEELPLDRALAELEARFAGRADDPLLAEVKEAVRRRLLARAQAVEGEQK